MKINDILIAGIGGQGTILASRLIAAAALEKDIFVRTSETIGMAQRGGSVVSHVRLNSENKNASIPTDTADLIIAFDQTEALRNIHKLKPNGKLLINKKDEAVPLDGLGNSIFIDGYKITEQVGSSKVLNVIMIGTAIKYKLLDFEVDFMKKIIEKNIAEKFRDLNINAFECSIK